jgi:hypothetical protein
MAFAGSWRGALVDAKCYDAEQRNMSPTNSDFWVNRDRGMEVWYCAPKNRTKSFEIVDYDGYVYKFDSAGDSKAAQLLRTAGKKSTYVVDVTGDISQNTIAVQSIALAPH